MSKTVTVGCKLPSGLIIDHKGMFATLNGANHSELIGGYGMTEVDEDLWNAWSSAFHDNPLITDGIIFAQKTKASAKSAAREREDVKSGFERLNPEEPTPGIKKAKED